MSQQQYIKDVCCSILQNTSEYHKIRSILYEQSHLIFQKLHQKTSPITVNQAAKEYDDALNEQIELVEQYYHELALSKERQEYLKLSAIWQLCQIVYFSDQKNDIEALVKWYNRVNSSLYYEYDRQAIFNNPDGPFEHSSFWPFAIRMTTLGRIDQLSALLKHTLLDVSVARKSDILPYLISLNDIISSLPLDKEKISMAIANLHASKWPSPKIEHHAEQLLAVMAILLGNEAMTLQHTQDDIHAYICCRFYQPAVGSFTEFSTRHPPTSSRMSPTLLPSQNVLRSIIAGDIYQAIEECVQYDWWLLAHLTDLLSMNQMIDREINIPVRQDTISVPVKSHFILYYASSLKNQFGLWKQAYNYMFECGDLGRQAVIEHLDNTDLNVDDSAITEVVDFCNHHSLESIGIEIYKRKATLCMESNDYSKALYYFKQSKQHQYIDTVFYKIIWHVALTGNWFDISSLNSEEYNGIYYTIYQHLHNLHNSIDKSDFKEAANEFRALVHNDSVPIYIMAIVISEGLAFVRDLDTSQLTTADLRRIKSLWQKMNKLTPAQDFKLLYCYNMQDKSKVPERDDDDLESELRQQKQEFLDSTGICFSRALERISP
ncbi:hypothetical protein PS15p_202261 [Mucor circinelloides]